MNNLQPIENNNQRVLTTAQIAERYETSERRISENFNRNENRFILGKHYYCLTGEELKQFKNDYANCGFVPGPKVNKFYLWTEKGALLHAKSLNTDKAWQAYEVLVDTYFEVQETKRLTGSELMAAALLEAHAVLEQKEKRITTLEQQAEQDKPKVLFADAVTASETSILVREFAKTCKQNGIEVGEKRLFEWLRENGYLIRKVGSDYNTPTQRAMEQGLFEVKKTAVHHASGEVTIGKTPKITGKGQIYFLNKLKEASEHNKQKVELWRAIADQRIRAYCKQSHINHMKFRKDLYGQLEKDFGFAFQDLLVILRQKRKKEGMTYKQCAALTNLDVIAANRALRDAFVQAMETVEANAQQMTL